MVMTGHRLHMYMYTGRGTKLQLKLLKEDSQLRTKKLGFPWKLFTLSWMSGGQLPPEIESQCFIGFIVVNVDDDTRYYIHL